MVPTIGALLNQLFETWEKWNKVLTARGALTHGHSRGRCRVEHPARTQVILKIARWRVLPLMAEYYTIE